MKTRAFLISSLALMITCMPPAHAKDEAVPDAKLEQMAESARTPDQHAEVAKQYRERAESFEAKAQKHEVEARKLEARPRAPIEYKWPAMSRKPWVKERQLAVEARRAAKECFDLAERHARLSEEAVASDRSERPSGDPGTSGSR